MQDPSFLPPFPTECFTQAHILKNAFPICYPISSWRPNASYIRVKRLFVHYLWKNNTLELFLCRDMRCIVKTLQFVPCIVGEGLWFKHSIIEALLLTCTSLFVMATSSCFVLWSLVEGWCCKFHSGLKQQPFTKFCCVVIVRRVVFLPNFDGLSVALD